MNLLKNEEIATNFPLTAQTLLQERGGNWMGITRNWIQRNARNGEMVVWGSGDLLMLKDQTVMDIEHLASSIAASAVADTRAEYHEFFRTLKPSGILSRRIHGERPTVVTKLKVINGDLDHDCCVGAHSWMEGGMAFGQGEFLSYGAWTHPCKQCTDEYAEAHPPGSAPEE